MLRQRRDRGSALLIATIIVLIALGIGAAFLSETVFRSKAQGSAQRADEALMICDAAVEKARRALCVYQNDGTWGWNEILTYCQNISTDAATIKADFNARLTTSQFTSYQTSLAQGTAGLNTSNEAPVPTNKTYPSTSDPTSSGVFIGWNVPYGNGAYLVVVRDNVTDPDGDPLKDGDNKVVLVVTATLRDGTQRQIESTIYYPYSPMKAVGIGAIVANAEVDLSGNITVDGNDWDINGTAVVGPGVHAVVSDETISIGGSSASGGNGTPPPSNGEGTNSLDPSHVFTAGFPAGPDEALEGKPGTLKAIAQSAGTYFTSQTSYEAYISANGGNIPGGKVIYVETDTTSPPFELGKTMNTEPSILVVHNSTSSTLLKNIHGEFKGVLFADAIDHINAGTNILGMIMAFSDSKIGNDFGNGNSTAKFSSAVLGNLPSARPNACTVLDWRKILQ
ncbi:MAG TPA: hypothetical protein VJB14_04310 [Planctomycetota bacterium]|nr:hypothetical protein [Planctomycetota bacterium]